MDERFSSSASMVALAGAVMFFGLLLLVVPLNLFQGHLPTPILPLIAIFLYGLDRPDDLPPWLSFAAGLVLDLLFGAAIGPWATVFLTMHAAILWQRGYFQGRDGVVLTTGYGAASLLALMLYWFEMSILSGRAMPISDVLVQWLVTLAVFPVFLRFFRRFFSKRRSYLAS
jgi:rod shape-determining protein MreD